MDPEALKASWAEVARSGDEVPLFFYSHLFLAQPQLRSMFPIAMDGQRDRFVVALGRIVSNVDAIDEVVGYIEQLGRDHRRFAVVAEHYSVVGASLLTTLRYFLGSAWTEELAADWAEAYGLVAKVMVQAAEESEATTPAWWDAEVLKVERRTLDVTVLTLRPHERLDFAPGQSMAMEIPQRPRLWRYFSPANAPRQDGTLELHVQPVDGGLVSSAVVRTLAAGETVRLGAPVGHQLTVDPATAPPLLMVAGGTGLAPLLAVFEQLDEARSGTGPAPDVHLFHGARMPWNLYEHGRLRELAATRPWFEYTGVVSDDPSYPGPRGMVGTPAAAAGPGRVALVCGSPEMVRHSVSELLSAGVDRGDIHCEQFTALDSSAASSDSGDAP
ncbi:globin domain-containing protein [Nocardioides donggukensis]|uniref:nitric oxide dioxygenase n=1 Tax=Nocardioides donggukensis TaxID=2774019 RepID=A0A927Q0S6_9ACTN|nr:globin domain-containing protein [Nocardioides donggukensis]MBD8868769.1 oxidoreductase [Nocardioides donggukensis]